MLTRYRPLLDIRSLFEILVGLKIIFTFPNQFH